MSPLLRVRDLACGYRGTSVVRGVSFSIIRGEVVALLGVNGSGKSTLLKTIAKALRPLSGEIFLGDDPFSRLSDAEAAKRVAFVPQEERFDFPFSVREVVGMGRLPYAKSLRDSAEDLAATEAAMDAADCRALADRPINELSGGERQRALIARALAQDAPLLLLDEPTSHLDVSHQMETAALIRRLAAEGRGALAAIHDLNLAARLADRALLLDDGAVALDGPISEVLASPQLDAAFGVAFERFTDSGGQLRVLAR